MLDRIYKKVKKFVNTDVRGNVTPAEFELFVHNAIQDRNEEVFYDFNRLVTRENRGMIVSGLANIVDRFSEKLSHYLKDSEPYTIVEGRIAIPDDVRYMDEPQLTNGTTLELCNNKREFTIQKTFAKKQYPIYRIVGGEIEIAPDLEGDGVTLSYLRKVKYPKWTYRVIQGVEIFNADSPDYQDADIHVSEEEEIVRRVLMAFGVNLKDQEIQAYAATEENSEFNKNNAN